MARDGCNFYFSFWPTFCPFIPVTARKIKIKKKKNEKTPGDIIIVQMCNIKYDHMMYSSWGMVRDGKTDGRKKWHIEVGTAPKNNQEKELVTTRGLTTHL